MGPAVERVGSHATGPYRPASEVAGAVDASGLSACGVARWSGTSPIPLYCLLDLTNHLNVAQGAPLAAEPAWGRSRSRGTRPLAPQDKSSSGTCRMLFGPDPASDRSG